jgi:ABC-type multidrug transport system ATPase subunit
MTPVLNVQGLRFDYPDRPLFADWSACFKTGVTWLRGHNGCGKTTLMKLLAGALPAARGRFELAGMEMSKQPLAYRRALFWVGPDVLPFDHLTPAEYFGFVARLYPRFNRAALDSLVAGFALAAQLAVPLRTLSTGTQRKVSIAAALASDTDAILLDEPVSALDAASHAHLAEALAACASERRRICIISSHEDLGAATALATVLALDACPSGTGRACKNPLPDFATTDMTRV